VQGSHVGIDHERHLIMPPRFHVDVVPETRNSSTARAIGMVLLSVSEDFPHADSFVAELGPTDLALATKLTLVPALVGRRASANDAAAALGNGVLALDSVPLALFCFLRWGNDFETAITQTVLCGGDVDSIAAMRGIFNTSLIWPIES
jgi:poly(ADP-ribose) glycohydrolase ARH3